MTFDLAAIHLASIKVLALLLLVVKQVVALRNVRALIIFKLVTFLLVVALSLVANFLPLTQVKQMLRIVLQLVQVLRKVLIGNFFSEGSFALDLHLVVEEVAEVGLVRVDSHSFMAALSEVNLLLDRGMNSLLLLFADL